MKKKPFFEEYDGRLWVSYQDFTMVRRVWRCDSFSISFTKMDGEGLKLEDFTQGYWWYVFPIYFLDLREDEEHDPYM